MMDIKKLRNNELRKQFLVDRNPEDGWYLWINQPEVDREFWRVDIEGYAFVVEMELHERIYPKRDIVWYEAGIYVIPVEELENTRKRPFSTYATNNSQCIEKLKELGRRK